MDRAPARLASYIPQAPVLGGGVGPGPALFGTRIPPGAARGTRLPERGGAQGGGEGVELAWECGK